jgi:hypothetical protein
VEVVELQQEEEVELEDIEHLFLVELKVTASYYAGEGIPVTVGAGGAGGTGLCGPGPYSSPGNSGSIFGPITSVQVEVAVEIITIQVLL